MPATTFSDIIRLNDPIGKEPKESFSIFKTNDDKRLVFGWASISIKVNGEQLEDRQQDIIDPEDLEEAAYEYVLNFRDTGEEHIKSMRKKGKLVESCVFTAEKQKAIGIPEGTLPIGWWIGFKIEDDDAWARVKNGTYKMFSIEGKANREPVEKAQPVAKTFFDVLKANPYHDVRGRLTSKTSDEPLGKMSPTKRHAVAKSFFEILKFNPYHDARGRFSTADGYTSFTTHTKDPNKQHMADKAVARMKQQAAQAAQAAPPKPQKNYDKLGFADHDDADFHQLYNGKQYYNQQKLTATQKKAADNYLEDNSEAGSLYSHSQNMNYMMATGQTLTGKYKQTHDGLMSAMHNVGYNVELTRYDHDGMINGLLQSLGAGSNYQNMSQSALQKALVGQTINENKFISTSYNNFKNATDASTFTSRAVKINYKVKADVQAMMPGVGPGGDFGEIVLAPTNGTANRGGKIVGARFTGQMARRKGTQMYNQRQIEIDIEI